MSSPPQIEPTLNLPASAPEGATLSSEPTIPPLFASPGTPHLAGYEILGELGRGGMGVVYKARYLALDRIVALKMILSGAHASAADLTRFHAEALAVSRLQHPNVVQIFDTGEQNGLPYFSLEFCGGGSLESRLRGQPQSPHEAAALLRTLALAMHAAHAHGIVHRDLKPANVLLAEDGTPKVTDFGLAKKLDEGGGSGQTASGTIMGTPSYMAPEQAAGLVRELGPAADIYALGAMLYELLIGRPPFRADTMMNTVLQVLQEEPVPPRRLQPKVPVDLETICLKCLEKSPKKRYASAGELADDLGRFLAGEPILARPVGPIGRLVKWTQRRPAVAALLALVLVVTTVGFGLVTAQWLAADEQRRAAELARGDAEDKRREAEEQKRLAEQMSARLVFEQGLAICETKDLARGLVWLAHSLDMACRSKAADLETVIRANLADWSTQANPLLRRLDHPQAVLVSALTPDGRTVLTVCADGQVRLWDAASGKESIIPDINTAGAGALSPDGRTFLVGGNKGEVWWVDPAKRQAVLADTRHEMPVVVVAFSGDGKVACTIDQSGRVQRWDAIVRKPNWSHSFELRAESLSGADGKLSAWAALSQDGKIFVVALGKGPVEGWDTVADKRVTQIHLDSALRALALSPDGATVLTGEQDFHARLWDTATGKQKGVTGDTGGFVVAVAFHPQNSQVFLTGSWGMGAQEWELGAGNTLRARGPQLWHEHWVLAAAYSPEGDLIATTSRDGTVRLWQSETGKPMGPALPHPGGARSLVFAADGNLLLTQGPDRAVRLWGVRRTGELPHCFEHTDQLFTTAFTPDGKTLVTGGWDRWVRVWSISENLWAKGEEVEYPDRVQATAVSRDGKTLLVGFGKNEVGVGGAEVRTLDKSAAAYRLPHLGTVRAVAISPDGRFFLTGCADSKVRLWQAADPAKDPLIIPHPGPVWSVAFSPDGRTLLTGCAGEQGNCAQMWDVGSVLDNPTTEPRFRLPHQGQVECVAYSLRGDAILTGSEDGTARLWSAKTGKPLVPPLVHAGAVTMAAFSPDGRWVVTGTSAGKVRFWDVPTGLPLGSSVQVGERAARALTVHPDGQSVAYGTVPGAGGFLPVPVLASGSPEEVMRRMQALTGLEWVEADSAVRAMSAP